MAYKTRTPLKPVVVAVEKIRTVLTLPSQDNITTTNLGKVTRNTTGYQ